MAPDPFCIFVTISKIPSIASFYAPAAGGAADCACCEDTQNLISLSIHGNQPHKCMNFTMAESEIPHFEIYTPIIPQSGRYGKLTGMNKA